MRHLERVAGAWRGLSAGGCVNYDTFVDNPRVALVVPEGPAADVQVELHVPAAKAASDRVKLPSVGLELLALDSALATDKLPSKPLAASGAYRRGFCLLEVRGLTAGRYALTASTFEPRCMQVLTAAPSPHRYALTASTFEPRQEAGFSVVVGSSVGLTCKLLAPEGHGLERSLIRGAWAAGSTAAGCPNFGNFHNNPQYRLAVSRRTEFLVRLRLSSAERAGGGKRPALGLDLYQRDAPLGPDEARGRSQPLRSANGGVYSYPAGGMLLARAPLEAGVYVLVPSTFEPLAAAYELLWYAESGAVRVDQLR